MDNTIHLMASINYISASKNPITLHSLNGINIKRLSLQIKGAKIEKHEDSLYNVRIEKSGKYEMVVLQDGKPLYTTILKSDHVPACEAMVASKITGKVPFKHIRAELGVIAHLPGFDFDAEIYWHIDSFRMIRIRNGLETEILNKGASFNTQTKKIINDTEPGDIYFFYFIICSATYDKE